MPRDPDTARLLTVKECCERLHVSVPTLYALINSGELRSITIGRARRIPVSALTRYIDEALERSA